MTDHLTPMFFTVSSHLFKFLILLVAMLVAKLVLTRYLRKLKGSIGERRVATELAKLPRDFRVLHDVLFKTDRAMSQIDHLVISPYGIFIIETKTYDGWIFGDENSEFWIQVLHNQKNRFYNPILQNLGHVRTVQRLLAGYKYIPYHPIVVFDGGCELKKVPFSTPVIYLRQLTDLILNVKTEVVLGDADI